VGRFFPQRFRVIQKSERQLVVAAIGSRDPSDCLKDLLGLPVRVEKRHAQAAEFE